MGAKFKIKMPRSKKAKVVALTKTKKQGREAKENWVQLVQEAADTYKNIFVLNFKNMRTGPFREIQRSMRSDSKFFIGKNKVIQVGLGRTSEDEFADNTHLLSKYMIGHVCLLATNKTHEKMIEELKEKEVEDFATAGVNATYDVFLAKGTEALSAYPHSLEPYLKLLGLSIKLNFQKLELLPDVYVCKEGQVLNVEQSKILKLLGYKMSTFRLTFLCQRTQKGKFREFDEGKQFLDEAGKNE